MSNESAAESRAAESRKFHFDQGFFRARQGMWTQDDSFSYRVRSAFRAGYDLARAAKAVAERRQKALAITQEQP